MPPIEDLEKALIKADAAGDVEAAQALAAEISRRRSEEAETERTIGERILRQLGFGS